MTDKTGGPARPTCKSTKTEIVMDTRAVDEDGLMTTTTFVEHDMTLGMTILDEFAGKALANIKDLIELSGLGTESWDQHSVVVFAYEIAVEMVANKQRREAAEAGES